MKYILIISLGLVLCLISFSYLLTHNKNFPSSFSSSFDQKSQYECGLELFEEHSQISLFSKIKKGRDSPIRVYRNKEYIKYYIIALIFLLFDLESILLYPFTLLFSFPISSLITPSILFSMENNILDSPFYFNYFILYFFLSCLFGGLLFEIYKKVL